MKEDRARPRLRQAGLEAKAVADLVEDLVNEIDEGEKVDQETLLFLIDRAQSHLSKVRSHVRYFFEVEEKEGGLSRE